MTVEPVIDAEIVDLTPDEAHEVTARIRDWMEFPADAMKRAWMGRVWLAMGYTSWEKWCIGALGRCFKLPAAQRRFVVRELYAVGMPQRAIAKAINVDQKTVSNDLRFEENSSPQLPPKRSDDQDDPEDSTDENTGAETNGDDEPDDLDHDDNTGAEPYELPVFGHHGNSRRQVTTLEKIKPLLSATTTTLEMMFPGTWDRTCTPQDAHTAAAELRGYVDRIVAVIEVLEAHG